MRTKHTFVAFNHVLQFKVSTGHFYICQCPAYIFTTLTTISQHRTLFYITISIKYCSRNTLTQDTISYHNLYKILFEGYFNIGYYNVLHIYVVFDTTQQITLHCFSIILKCILEFIYQRCHKLISFIPQFMFREKVTVIGNLRL